ncbi:MAG: hypothetical protein WD004_08415 [Actinomycetota bacterium]
MNGRRSLGRRRRALARVALAVAVVAAVFLMPVPAQAAGCSTTFVWSGTADTNWFNPLNWGPNGVPDNTSECAVIPSGNVDLPASITVDGLNINSPAATLNILAGQSLTVTDLNVSGGYLTGGGQVVVQATFQQAPGSQFKLCQNASIVLTTFVNGSIGDNAQLRMRRGSSVIVDGWLSLGEDAGILTYAGPDGAMCNDQAFGDARLTVAPNGQIYGMGTSSNPAPEIIDVAVHNEGSIDGGPWGMDLSPLRLLGGDFPSGSFYSNGQFSNLQFGGGLNQVYRLEDAAEALQVSVGFQRMDLTTEQADLRVLPGATALFDGRVYGSTISGGGILEVPSGAVLNMQSPGPAEMASMLGSGTTHLNGGNLIADMGGVRIGGCDPPPPSPCGAYRTVDNDGYVAIDTDGHFVGDDGTTFINRGTFDIQNDFGYYKGAAQDGVPSTVFDNKPSGVIIKTAEPTPGEPSIIQANYTGSGAVNSLVGQILIWDDDIDASIDPGNWMATGTTKTVNPPGGISIPGKDFATGVHNLDSGVHDFSIDESTEDPPSKGGYDFFPYTTRVQALDVNAGIDADVEFGVDAGMLSGGEVYAFNHGVMVPECPDAFTIDPDPCVVRSFNGEGDVVLLIRTTQLGAPATSQPSISSPEDSRAPFIRGHARRAPVDVDASASEVDDDTLLVQDAGITPASTTVVLGTTMNFVLDPGHTAQDANLLGDAGVPLFAFAADDDYRYPAGTFTVEDPSNSDTATVKVKPQAAQIQPDKGHEIGVTWSSAAAVEGCTMCAWDVQYKVKKSGTKKWTGWKTWENDETDPSGTFDAPDHGRYKFRARLVETGMNTVSGWSPTTSTVKVAK